MLCHLDPIWATALLSGRVLALRLSCPFLTFRRAHGLHEFTRAELELFVVLSWQFLMCNLLGHRLSFVNPREVLP